MFRRGQVNSIDAMVAMVAFIMLLVFIISFWGTMLASKSELLKRTRFEYGIVSASDALIKSAGFPSNWETNASGVRTIGLALSPNVLSYSKLSNFTALPYATQKKLLGIYPDFYFFLQYQNGTRAFATGNSSIFGSQIAAVQRVGILGNQTVTMELMTYG
jgi:hypothetical protein